MPYINYDENGNITGQFANKQYDGQLYTTITDFTSYKVVDGVVTDVSNTDEYIANRKSEQLEILTGQYTNDKCERMVSWVSTFISGISTATSLDDIKSKANAFKTKLAALQNDYTTKCTEVENG